VQWLLAETYEEEKLCPASIISEEHRALGQSSSHAHSDIVEVGPRLNFQTAWSTNAVSIFHSCGVANVIRIEKSRRYLLYSKKATISEQAKHTFVNMIHDRMTEQHYEHPLTTFDSGLVPAETHSIDLMSKGIEELKRANVDEGLGFDDWDIQYYYDLFVNKIQRNPTNVELFDMAQSNSEHSRHWFFKGKMIIDGQEMKQDLFSVVRDTLRANPSNSVVAFSDNSSTIKGFTIDTLNPKNPGVPSEMKIIPRDMDILCTAETHNFPSGVAPFPGAETGAGGRMRDSAATGTGSLLVAGFAGYSVGNLNLEGHELPWEQNTGFMYPDNLATPRRIAIEASNGASDYGNKFGEPLISGFCRSYGVRDASGVRREYVKPIMFSGGVGQMLSMHARKQKPQIGMYVVKVGGPAYRIGMGGGAASSMVQGANKAELDLNAVQRGDAEMEQKTYRVLRACVEMGEKNPILSLHDQGAGGNCNVVKELIDPLGARIDLREINLGDTSLSAVEIWGAEYQENFGLLIGKENIDLFRKLCEREKTKMSVLGSIDGSGKIVLYDRKTDQVVEDLELDAVLGELPQKSFYDSRVTAEARKKALIDINWDDVKLPDALDRVLKLMSVCSKRFLTTKVDRSVTGLVAQQQTVGPLQLPLADVGVIAQTMFGLTGAAIAIGECPALTVLSPHSMARKTVGEMMTNLCAARITAINDIKCEGNWMWAAKLPGEGADIYDAATSMRDIMIALGIAIDGGKDSVSMAARCPTPNGQSEMVKAPGTLVVSGYATMKDVRKTLTPDLKKPGNSTILHVALGAGSDNHDGKYKAKMRLGGSALAQVYKATGIVSPDVDDPKTLRVGLDTILNLHDEAYGSTTKPLAYHDISDGGLIVALLEMGFAGNCGMDVTLPKSEVSNMKDAISMLFSEEVGILLEVDNQGVEEVMKKFAAAKVHCSKIASSRMDHVCSVKMENGTEVLSSDIRKLRDTWESTAFVLERLQAAPECVDSEQKSQYSRKPPPYKCDFSVKPTPSSIMSSTRKHKVAIIREEGSNGDREMAAAFYLAGLEPWDVHVNDIANGNITLDQFRGAVFVGGFSYADVLDSAKGWAGTIRFRENVRTQFEKFFARSDTFSLGVCNGCQLMALLGIVPFGMSKLSNASQPRFIHNDSSRYESRFSTVKIETSPSIMLKNMTGAQLGIWVAHGEGKAYFPDESILRQVQENRLFALTYINDDGQTTEQYPFNPNGATKGIAGLCSPDGRHLAMMPHPERAVLSWQWPYMSPEMEAKAMASDSQLSPWIQMFQNAREWCDQSSSHKQ